MIKITGPLPYKLDNKTIKWLYRYCFNNYLISQNEDYIIVGDKLFPLNYVIKFKYE